MTSFREQTVNPKPDHGIRGRVRDAIYTEGSWNDWARFAKCGPQAFGSRLHFHGIAKEDVDRLAWRCKPGECEPWLSSVGVPSDIVPADGDALGACGDAKLANGVPAPVLLFVIDSTEDSKRSI